MPPPILVLNDDVLLQIADYLLGRDALSFSLTSKQVYDLAIHRVSALIHQKNMQRSGRSYPDLPDLPDLPIAVIDGR